MANQIKAPINYPIIAGGKIVSGGSVIFGQPNVKPDPDNPSTLKAVYLDAALTQQAENPQGISSDGVFDQSDTGILYGPSDTVYSIVILGANKKQLSYIPEYDLSDANAAATAQSAAAQAESAASNAIAAKDLTEALYTDFVNRYFGAYSSDPSVDPEGNPPSEGSIYFNTTSNVFFTWHSGVWNNDFPSNPNGLMVTATGTTTPRSLSDRFGDVVHTKDYGILFDGITDQTDKFQGIIDDLAGNYGGTIVLQEGDVKVSTLSLKAGVVLTGGGVYKTRIIGSVQVSSGTYFDRVGAITGNGTGQYHTGIKDLTLYGDGTGIGLNLRESWWGKFERVIIQNFDTGCKLGIGTSGITGCYWNLFEHVWHKGNNTNLHITDFTNLNNWKSCRFDTATDWDVEFVEPSTPLGLGMEGNSFEDCEMASLDSIRLAAKIWDLSFNNIYFEQKGYIVLDDSTHSKRSISFNECKFFGANSLKNKIVAGVLGQCTDWHFTNCTTNLSRDPSAPNPLNLVDMQSNAFWFKFTMPRLENGPNIELVSPSTTNKDKWRLQDARGNDEIYSKSIISDGISSADIRMSKDPQSDQLALSVKSNSLSFAKDVGSFTSFDVISIKRGSIASAYSATAFEMTLSGRDLTNAVHASWNYKGLIIGNGTSVAIVTINDNSAGAGAFNPTITIARSGDDIVVTANNPSGPSIDQTNINVTASASGNFIGYIEKL